MARLLGVVVDEEIVTESARATTERLETAARSFRTGSPENMTPVAFVGRARRRPTYPVAFVEPVRLDPLAGFARSFRIDAMALIAVRFAHQLIAIPAPARSKLSVQIGKDFVGAAVSGSGEGRAAGPRVTPLGPPTESVVARVSQTRPDIKSGWIKRN